MHLSDKPAIIAKYNMEMFLLVKFLDIIFVPNLSRLDLRERLQPVRNHLYEHLSKFPRAEVRHEKDDSFWLKKSNLYNSWGCRKHLYLLELIYFKPYSNRVKLALYNWSFIDVWFRLCILEMPLTGTRLICSKVNFLLQQKLWTDWSYFHYTLIVSTNWLNC